MRTYSVRKVESNADELLRDMASGSLSIVTHHGKPVFIAVPFDDAFLENGVRTALAVKLYDDEVVSIGMAEKIAGCPFAEFNGRLSKLGIPCVKYSPEELRDELK